MRKNPRPYTSYNEDIISEVPVQTMANRKLFLPKCPKVSQNAQKSKISVLISYNEAGRKALSRLNVLKTPKYAYVTPNVQLPAGRGRNRRHHYFSRVPFPLALMSAHGGTRSWRWIENAPVAITQVRRSRRLCPGAPAEATFILRVLLGIYTRKAA